MGDKFYTTPTPNLDPDNGPVDNALTADTVIASVQNIQLPVIYTKTDGTKVYKLANGSFNTQADGNGNNVEAKDVVAAMQNANDSTITPTALTNIASGISGNVDNGAGTNTFIDNLTNAAGNRLNQAST